MNYPLQLSFEILSVARKLSVIDAAGNLSFFVKQKMFKLKESVTVFADVDQRLPLYELKADRVIDFPQATILRIPVVTTLVPSGEKE